MNVQIIRFVNVRLRGLCLKICNSVRCNKGLVSQDSSTVAVPLVSLCSTCQREKV